MSILIKFKKNQISELTGETPSKNELEKYSGTDLQDLYDEFGKDVLEILDANQLKDVLVSKSWRIENK